MDTKTIIGSAVLIASFGFNVFQYVDNRKLNKRNQELEGQVLIAGQRANLYRFRQDEQDKLLAKVSEAKDRALEYSEDLSEVMAQEIRGECTRLEALRDSVIKEIRDRERAFKIIAPDYKTTSDKQLQNIGVPGCLDRVKVVLMEKLTEMINTLDQWPQMEDRIEKVFRFASVVRDEWTKIETGQSSVNLRASADRGSDVVFAVPPGTSLQVLAYRRGRAWIKVRDPETGKVGWVWEKLVVVPPSGLRPS